jgi:gamma-glutamyl-gamma-aminobutyrate hydrolase PuuD
VRDGFRPSGRFALQPNQPDDERDEVELQLIDEAIERDVPMLAICRGLQILNVHHSGTLIQHLSSAGRHSTNSETLRCQYAK